MYGHIFFMIIRFYEYLYMFIYIYIYIYIYIFIHILRKNGLNLNKYLFEYYQLNVYLQ